jgi:hypothetical protein
MSGHTVSQSGAKFLSHWQQPSGPNLQVSAPEKIAQQASENNRQTARPQKLVLLFNVDFQNVEKVSTLSTPSFYITDPA